jgi:RelE-like toxin of type II toxin-antitoxin system HigB
VMTGSCAAGSIWDATLNKCAQTSCPVNQFLSSGLCAPCALGFESAGGAVGVCSKIPVVCPANQYANAAKDACVNCPVGYLAPAGSSGADSCVKKICPANEYLNGNSCNACPVGSSSNAGSDAKSDCKYTAPTASIRAADGTPYDSTVAASSWAAIATVRGVCANTTTWRADAGACYCKSGERGSLCKNKGCSVVTNPRASTRATQLELVLTHSQSARAQLSQHYAVWVNANWRITYAFEGGDVILLDYQDYH